MNMVLMVMKPPSSSYLPVLVNSYGLIPGKTCMQLVEVEMEGAIRGYFIKDVTADS